MKQDNQSAYFLERVRGRIAYMTEPGNVEVRDYELPSSLEPMGVLLEVIQSNVCGTDIHIFHGRHPLVKCGGLGHEMVGRVIRLGDGVKTDSAGAPIRVGDRVVPVYTGMCHQCENCARGVLNHCDKAFEYFGQVGIPPHFHGATFATHYYVHPNQPFYRVPDGVSNASAASANCALSQVMYGLERAGVTLGDHVLIQGAGGLGVLATAVAKERGATVVVLDRVQSRLEFAKQFGADHIINVDELSELADRVKVTQEFFQRQGADVVLEVTGVPAVFAEGVSYLRAGGTYVVMGTISPGLTTQFDPGLLVRKSATIMGINRYPPQFLWQAMSFLERAEKKYPFGELLDRAFTLDQTQQAIEMSSRREVQRATIVLTEETA